MLSARECIYCQLRFVTDKRSTTVIHFIDTFTTTHDKTADTKSQVFLFPIHQKKKKIKSNVKNKRI